jgi:hypothetical protein
MGFGRKAVHVWGDPIEQERVDNIESMARKETPVSSQN